MTTDDAEGCTTSTAALTVHAVEPDGTLGAQVGAARPVMTTAAVLEPAADALDRRPEPPQLPLALVDADGHRIEVMTVHVSELSAAIALEVADPVLVVPEPQDDEPRTLPARSIWCRIFPRMRGC